MNKTNIEYCEFTVNPIVGKCPHYGTSMCGTYCYAEPIRKKMYPERIQFLPDRLKFRKKPATIFIGSMFDIFADEVLEEDIKWIIREVCKYKQHTFLFLTKNPKRYMEFVFPSNCWLGETITGKGLLSAMYPTGNKFISFEPLLGPVKAGVIEGYQWIIIGSLNKFRRAVSPKHGGTKIEWVYPIIEQADKFRIPVFIKEELLQLYPELTRRKELPDRKELPF